jgi:hypothetical protein
LLHLCLLSKGAYVGSFSPLNSVPHGEEGGRFWLPSSPEG